jgi:hypothetical protein
MAADNGTKVFYAPMAVIKINGITCGYMQTLECTENINRGEVQGIGSVTLQQVPVVGMRQSLRADFFFISLKRPELLAFIKRDLGLNTLVNTLILSEIPTSIYVYKKNILTQDKGIVTAINSEGELIGAIDDFYINSQTWNIRDNQISGSNVSGVYLKPIFFAS